MAIYHKLLNSIDMEKLKILNLNFSFQRAAHYHINGGMLLMGVVLLAMFLANSPWGDIYASFWNYEVHLQIGEFNFFSHNGHHMTLMTFINDALMYNPQIQISAESGTKRSIFRQKNKTKRSKKRLHTTLIKPEQKVNEDLCSGFIVS